MTKSTITREQAELRAFITGFLTDQAHDKQSADSLTAKVFRIALAAMASEPVAWTDEEELRDANESGSGYLFGIERDANKFADPRRQIMLYRHEQPAAEYPEKLPRPVLLEPGMRFGKGVKTRLVLDAIQRRAEHYAELEAMTPKERAEHNANIEAFKAMLPQPAPVVPDIGEIRVGRRPTMNQDECPGLGDWWVQLRIGEDSDEVLARVYGATPQEANNRAEALACRAAMLQAEPVTTANKLGNSPVIPDTWIPVSERMPEDEQEVLTINRMGHRFVSLFDKHSGLFFDRLDAPSACCIEHVLVTHWMELPAAPQEVKP
ncbi:TPA: DUF551 domain-containing protein [Klebsiella aerogenes]